MRRLGGNPDVHVRTSGGACDHLAGPLHPWVCRHWRRADGTVRAADRLDVRLVPVREALHQRDGLGLDPAIDVDRGWGSAHRFQFPDGFSGSIGSIPSSIALISSAVNCE
jgi:hypothetical protein